MKLTTIARDLTQRARRNGVARHALPRGLALKLVYDRLHGAWTLSLGRKLVRPSDKECEICRVAFGVPDDAGRTQTVVQGWNVIRYEWLESRAVQAAMWETEPRNN